MLVSLIPVQILGSRSSGPVGFYYGLYALRQLGQYLLA